MYWSSLRGSLYFYDMTLFDWITMPDSPRDSVQFIEWSPSSCPRALLIANFHGRITIWTQPSQVSFPSFLTFNPRLFVYCLLFFTGKIYVVYTYTYYLAKFFRLSNMTQNWHVSWYYRDQLIWSKMLVLGNVSMSGGRILQLLQSGYLGCLLYEVVTFFWLFIFKVWCQRWRFFFLFWWKLV